MIVKLPGYAPDADPTILGVLTNCSGVVPSLKGIKGAPSAAATPLATLAATCQGAAVLTKLDASTRFFAATSAKIYEAASSTWTDVSRAAAYTANSVQRTRFAQFGNVSIAANGADTMQASVSSGAFSCIAGAPIAAIVETVGKFVFGLNTPANPQGVQWSGLNDYTNWTPAIATQAGSDSITATPGPITAGRKFGNTIVVYKKNSMFLGINTSPPNIWEFAQIPGTAGAMSQESVVNIGTPENPKHIFMGENDFYIFDGSKPVPIGSNRVKLTVFNQLLQSRYYACSALHDRVNNLVYFYYPVADSTLPDHCVVYNYRTDQWGQDDRQIEMPVEYVTPGITWDSLGNTYSTWDSLPNLPWDLAFLNSAQSLPGVFGTDHLVKTLTGAAASTSITTGDFGDDVQFSTFTRARMRFITTPSSGTMTNFYRSPGNTLVSDVTTAMSSQNSFDAMRDAKWHRLMFSFTGDWEASGLAPEFVESGLE